MPPDAHPGLIGLPAALQLLAQRLSETGQLSLAAVQAGAPALLRFSVECRALLRRHEAALRSELQDRERRDLARFMGRGLTRYLMHRNQYLPPMPDWDRAADRLYLRLLDDLRDSLESQADPATALPAHADRLRTLLGRRQALGTNLGAEAVCADYTPRLQTQILRFEPMTALGPVLDLGCGECGHLVRHLHERGRRDAMGVDVLCETAGPLRRASWFEAPLELATWGTILAHQSFSLHAWRAHAAGTDEEAAMYAKAFMRVLRSLKPRGSFRFAPSLPFLEDLLPREDWEVTRWSLPIPRAGAGPFQATAVVRRSVDAG